MGSVTDALEIRSAATTDMALLRDLYRSLNPDDPVLDLTAAASILRRLALYPGSAVLLGVDRGVPVATCTLIVIPNLTRGGAPYSLIENVVTHPSRRRRGYGKAVLAEALARSWRVGCYKAMLLSGSDDPGTLGFYRSAGFEQSKTGFQIRHHPTRAK